MIRAFLIGAGAGAAIAAVGFSIERGIRSGFGVWEYSWICASVLIAGCIFIVVRRILSKSKDKKTA